jgi:hypothetical protein
MKLRFLILLLAVLPALRAQDHASGSTNPYNSAQDVASGGKLFRAACAAWV